MWLTGIAKTCSSWPLLLSRLSFRQQQDSCQLPALQQHLKSLLMRTRKNAFCCVSCCVCVPGLDWWTFEVIVMLSGLLPRPEQVGFRHCVLGCLQHE